MWRTMKSQNIATTTATRLAVCTLLITVALAIALLASSRAYAQQGCTRVKMIYAEAWNTLYMIDGNGNRLVDIQSGNGLSNNDIDSSIVLRGLPSKIGVEIAGNGETSYRYKNNVVQPGDRGYEDYIDGDFNDAVILITSVSCPGAAVPTPQGKQVRSKRSSSEQAIPDPSVSSVNFANVKQTSVDATVDIANAGTAEKTVRLRYRVGGTAAWSTTLSKKTRGPSRTVSLTGLTAGTTYKVQAWLDSNSPSSGTRIYTFSTLDANDPGISNLKFENIDQTSVTTLVEIEDAGTDMKEVFLKHSMEGAESWTMLPNPAVTYGSGASIEMRGLTPETTYHVAVALSDEFDEMVAGSFTTLGLPSIAEINIESKTENSVVVKGTISNPGTGQNTLKLHFRRSGEIGWGDAISQTMSGASVTHNLTELEPATTYEIMAYLSINPDSPKYLTFTTSTPDPSLSSIGVGSITQTTAVVAANIIYPDNGGNTVHLQYRESEEAEWSAADPQTTDGATATFELNGLRPSTEYEVEAWLGSDSAGSKTATFTTLALDPIVSALKVARVRQTTATANVDIAGSGGISRIVHMRYRTATPLGEWNDIDGPEGITAASIALSDLVADTDYEVEASLDADFGRAESTTFSTLRYPSISEVEITNVQKDGVTAAITVADPDGSVQTIHLRYRTTPEGTWSSSQETTSSTNGASISISELNSDTEYELEVSLDSDFAVAVSTVFATLPPDPAVSKVSVDGIRQTAATASVEIANTNGREQAVHLRYRTTTPEGKWNETQGTISSKAIAQVSLSGLAPGTEYEVHASLESSFPADRTKSESFATLHWPSMSSFSVEDIGRNGATVRATIGDSYGNAQTVYIRHRQTRYSAWRIVQGTDTVDDVADLRIRGLSSDTEYIAEASLDSTFPSGETMSATFTTQRRRNDDSRSSESHMTKAARVSDAPLLGFSPLTLTFTAIEGGDDPSPQTFTVWNRADGAMDFILSNHEEWLKQQPASGMSTGLGDLAEITASVDISELASGQYIDVINISVTSSGKAPGQVIVALDVLPPDYVRMFVPRNGGGKVVLPDGTVKIVVNPLAAPKDVDVELTKVDLMTHGEPPSEHERVAVAIDSNTFPSGGDTPEDVAYSPEVELWIMLPAGDADACAAGRVRLYSVRSGIWNLDEHRCETDESGNVWAVSEVERLSAFSLVIDDSPATPTPVAAAPVVPTATTTTVLSMPQGTAVQRTSLPARAPTPNPIHIAAPTPPVASGKPNAAPVLVPAPTATPTVIPSPVPAPPMKTTTGEQRSGDVNRILLAAFSIPLIVGALIVGLHSFRARQRKSR